MNIEQALDVLVRMQKAAPPKAASRIAGIIALLHAMDEENTQLSVSLSKALAGAGEPAAPASQTEDLFADLNTDLLRASLGTRPEPGGETAEFQSFISGFRSTKVLAPAESSASEAEVADIFAEMDAADAAARDLPSPSTDALTGAQAKLEAADVLLHQNNTLRPALVVLRGQAETMHGGILGPVPSEQLEALAVMRDNADCALALLDAVDDLLLLAQGKTRLHLKAFDPVRLVKEAYQTIAEAAQARENTLTLQVDDALPQVRGDYDLLLTTLVALLDNAIRYAPVGASTRISAETLGTHVLISVADTGIGLSDDDLAMIGQPFWRATHQALVRQHAGTGLHLHLAQRRLALQDGQLFFSGEPGLGSTFSFTIPAGTA